MKYRLPEFFVRLANYKTDNLIEFLFYKSKDMLFNKNPLVEVPIMGNINGIPIRKRTGYAPWDLLSIIYHSIKRGSDLNKGVIKDDQEFAELINSYRIYDNDNQSARYLENTDLSGIYKYMSGITSEQFLYHDLRWVLESLNRNYYIFSVIAKEEKSPIDLEIIIKDLFGMSPTEFISSILIIFELCMQHPMVLEMPEISYNKRNGTILTKENIKNIVNYYSVTYEEVRNSDLGKQIFYSKPFIITEKDNKYIAISMYLIAMTVANCLYWIPRNYFLQRKVQTFTNSFGILFEKYVEKVFQQYLKPEEFEKIQETSGKSADYILTLKDYIIIIELKSTLLALSGKQQEPDIKAIDTFCNRAIYEAYEQLNSSENKINSKKPIIKFILFYENFKNNNLFEDATEEIFRRDNYCKLITITELEMFISVYPANLDKFNDIIKKMTEKREKFSNRSILKLLEDNDILQNDFIGKIDHWDDFLRNLKNELE
jgi:hypothetical protein